MQTAGAINVSNNIKSVSAIKRRPSGHQQREQRGKRNGGANVLWKRITSSFDDDLLRFAKNPAVTAPLTRLVFFHHLTKKQGWAGRRYGSIVSKYERYCLPAAMRTTRSANLEPSRGGEDQEIERHIRSGTLTDYERDAKQAKRNYKRAMKVMAKFADPITGRNIAKDVLDDMVLSYKEPPSDYRRSLGVVLNALADEFGIEEK